MGSHVTDSAFFRDLFGTERMRGIFSDENMLQKWLDFEAALAESEAELGIIPEEAAREIRSRARAAYFDPEKLGEGVNLTRHPFVPFLGHFKSLCTGDTGEYIHWGATSQDAMDTGLVLQVKEAYTHILQMMEELHGEILALARRERDVVMAGRTLSQQALPMTLGFKVAIWACEMKRNIERMKGCWGRLFVGQLSGAVGTMAFLGMKGLDVQKKVMDRLGLGTPEIAWHASRDNFAEVMSNLGILAGTIGKIGNEIVCLQRTECAELEESQPEGRVGSSTMPHKRNPMMSSNMVSLSRLIRNNVPLALDAMVVENERDMRAWQTEWEFISETCVMTGALLSVAIEVVSRLTVKHENIRRNLEMTKGFILSEAVMARLSETLGRQKAHDLLHHVCMDGIGKGVTFEEALKAHSTLEGVMDMDELKTLLDPANYVGLSSWFVDKISGDGSADDPDVV